MHAVIGYLNKPTKDGRVLLDLTFRDRIPVLSSDKIGGKAEWLGAAYDFKVNERGVITCQTSYKHDPVHTALSMQLSGETASSQEPLGTVVMSGGKLMALVVLPRARWAW